MQTVSLNYRQFGNETLTRHKDCLLAVYITVWMTRIVTSVEPARGHMNTSLSDIAKSRNDFLLRHLRCADKHLSWLDS